MLSIVTFVWKGERDYGARHANDLKEMLDRYLRVPFGLTVIADDPNDRSYRDDICVVPLPDEAKPLAELRSPEGSRFPSSYRRLWLFSEAARWLGPRIILTDVDVVVTGDWSHLVQDPSDFVGWRPRMRWGGENRLAGGMWYLRTGTRTEVWKEFVKDPHAAIAKARAAGFRGSDQAWISYMLTDSAATWPAGAGIYSVRDFTRDPEEVIPDIPADACVVHFNGNVKPWMPEARVRHPWIDRFWPSAVDASGRAALG